jgi:hypothetical protein
MELEPRAACGRQKRSCCRSASTDCCLSRQHFKSTSMASLLLTKQTSTVSVRCWRTLLVELRLRQRPSGKLPRSPAARQCDQPTLAPHP